MDQLCGYATVRRRPILCPGHPRPQAAGPHPDQSSERGKGGVLYSVRGAHSCSFGATMPAPAVPFHADPRMLPQTRGRRAGVQSPPTPMQGVWGNGGAEAGQKQLHPLVTSLPSQLQHLEVEEVTGTMGSGGSAAVVEGQTVTFVHEMITVCPLLGHPSQIMLSSWC
jgi:hypothetical protein